MTAAETERLERLALRYEVGAADAYTDAKEFGARQVERAHCDGQAMGLKRAAALLREELERNRR